MKCEICGAREAVIHIQQVIGKERVDLHLCEECAVERGITSTQDRIELSISNLINGLVEVRKKKKPAANLVCPGCGSAWEAVNRREKMGCPECYTTFHREIRQALRRALGKAQHRGRLPRRLSTYKTFLVDMVKLKEGLDDALKREDYEKAARLRDRIRELESRAGEVE
ncbi:MAG: UvrB/UvrC motif-containing protein [Spirochaetales bacterium]|nr:UvrB/UvrC motif-containing protein [Spirochaetales bacterium]